MIVDESGILTGVLTDGDIRRTLIKYQNIRPLLARDVMSKNPKHISKTDYGASALNLMEKYSITALAVVDENNKPIGVISYPRFIKSRSGIVMSIKLVAFDVDGVLTDGGLIFDENGP